MDKDIKNPNGKGKVKTHAVRFNLKSITDKNKTTLISAVFRYNNQKLVYSTQHKIAPKHWSLRTQLPIISYLLYNDLKDELSKINDAIVRIYSDNKDNPLSLNDFKQKLDIVLNRVKSEPENQKVDFIDYLKLHIKKIRSDDKLHERTAQKYKTLLYNLQKFKPGKMDFDSIDMQFQKDYIFWRYEYTKAESQNTINKDFGSIKNILKLSFKEGLHKNTIFNEDDFHVKTAKTSIFALNESEVNRLYSFDFSDNPRLERVRDWFLISCWSALRWSDFSTIKPEHILKDGEDTFLRKKNIKTGTVVFIPVDERLYLMFEKYNFKSIDISNQKFNEYIKEVFEVVGITDNIILDTNFKGKDKEVIKRKCDIVSAHDGRRTWATINYLKGYAIGLLMQVTGHTQESTFLSYVGADPLAKAKALMKQQKEFASLQKSKY
ncbi:MAG: phage integrase SAM-like domain-containing protein [Saprospiraceae bacterium]|nr:phage integrase SAM-like domain-containing protein [Saprospiraceae bacterium]